MKKTSSFIFLVVICASLALLSACEYDMVVPEKAPPVIVGDTISYAQDIQPIFDVECANCHPSVYKPDLTAANSYNALINGNYVVSEKPDESLLYTKCKPGASMATHCSSAQLALIGRWINAGIKNN